MPRRRQWWRVDVLRDHAHRIVAQEGRPARQHLIDHAAQGVEVAARIRLPSEGLLRRHVGDRAEHHAFHRQPRAIESDGEAEVAELGGAVLGEPDVAGLEIAVDDAAGECACSSAPQSCRAVRSA